MDPCRIRVLLSSFLLLCWVSVPGFDQQRRDRQTGKRRRRRAAASVGFTVATETMSSLLNTCFWWHHTPGLSTHKERFCLNPETGHRAVEWGQGVSELMKTDNYWGRHTGIQLIAAVWTAWRRARPHRRRIILVQRLLWMQIVSLPDSTNSGRKLFSQEVGELSLLGLIYKKKRKTPEGRQSSLA